MKGSRFYRDGSILISLPLRIIECLLVIRARAEAEKNAKKYSQQYRELHEALDEEQRRVADAKELFGRSQLFCLELIRLHILVDCIVYYW